MSNPFDVSVPVEGGRPVCFYETDGDKARQLHLHLGEGGLFISPTRVLGSEVATGISISIADENREVGEQIHLGEDILVADLGPLVHLHIHNPEGAKVLRDALDIVIQEQTEALRERGYPVVREEN